MRSWASLPDQILMWTGTVPPGEHTVEVRFYDENDYELTRYRQTWYFVPANAGWDTLLVVRSARNRCDMSGKEAQDEQVAASIVLR